MDRPSVNQIAPGTHLEKSNGKIEKKCAIVAYPPHSAADRPIPKNSNRKPIAKSPAVSHLEFDSSRYTVAIDYI
jgi:hypothetical protein